MRHVSTHKEQRTKHEPPNKALQRSGRLGTIIRAKIHLHVWLSSLTYPQVIPCLKFWTLLSFQLRGEPFETSFREFLSRDVFFIGIRLCGDMYNSFVWPRPTSNDEECMITFDSWWHCRSFPHNTFARLLTTSRPRPTLNSFSDWSTIWTDSGSSMLFLMLPPGVSSDRRCEPTMMSKVTSLQL